MANSQGGAVCQRGGAQEVQGLRRAALPSVRTTRHSVTARGEELAGRAWLELQKLSRQMYSVRYRSSAVATLLPATACARVPASHMPQALPRRRALYLPLRPLSDFFNASSCGWRVQ